MPKTPSFDPRYDEKRDRWVLSIPPKYSETGKRGRKFFETEEEAKLHANKVVENAAAAHLAVSRAGPEIIRAAVNYDELFRDVYGIRGGLIEGCEELIKRIDEEQRAPRFGELVEAYEKEYSDKWTPAYKTKWTWFKNAVEPLSSENTLKMDGNFWVNWMRDICEEKGWSDGTANDLLSKLRSIFKLAVALSLAERNPMEGIRRRKIRMTEKAVYTVEEVKKLMDCAWKHDREMVPYYGFAIFAGLRPGPNSEIERLLWEDVDFDSRQVCAGKRYDNKTGKRRFIDIEDNLYEWLKSWKGATGKVTPSNLTNRRRWIVKGKYQAGQDTPEDEWEELVPNGLDYRDITRHTYGSFLDAKYRDRNKVKEFMGHNNFETYEQHYRNARTPQEAGRFWAILPPQGNSGISPVT